MADTDLPIVCNLDALPDRAHHERVTEQLMSQAEAVAELADGYRLVFPIGALALAADFIDGERLCCPFFEFTLSVAPVAQSFHMGLTGREGVKALLAAELEGLLSTLEHGETSSN